MSSDYFSESDTVIVDEVEEETKVDEKKDEILAISQFKHFCENKIIPVPSQGVSRWKIADWRNIVQHVYPDMAKERVQKLAKRDCYKLLKIRNPQHEGLLTRPEFKTHCEQMTIKEAQEIYAMGFKINNSVMIRHLNENGVLGTRNVKNCSKEKLCLEKLKRMFKT